MIKKFALIVFCMIVCSSCQRNDQLVYTNYQETTGYWHKDSIQEFHFSPNDTLGAYNLIVYTRNDQSYPFNNLLLITKMEFPSGRIIADTLEYNMAYPDGRMLGQGNNMKENRLLFKENVTFFEEGNYRFSIQHAMRKAEEIEGVKKLKGVYNIGIEIERNSPE